MPLIIALECACAFGGVALADPYIADLIPVNGCYGGTIIEITGAGFDVQQSGDGYHSFVTLTSNGDLPDTMIATRYRSWSDTNIDVVLAYLFIDEDGDYLQDGNEAFLSAMPSGNYDVSVDTIWFEDQNGNGIYDDEIELSAISLGNELTFDVVAPDISVSLAPDKAVFYRGESLGFQATVTNNSDVATTTVFFVTKVVMPNGGWLPSSGYLSGPKRLTLPPNESRSAHITHRISQSAQLGSYRYYGGVALYGVGTKNVDSFGFQVAHYSEECSACHTGIHYGGHLSVPCTACH
jgi:hypothetical protein